MVMQTDPPKKQVGYSDQRKVRTMILSVCAKLKDIYEQGRNFKWSKPDRCKRCGSLRVWGHGFVVAYFDGFMGCFYLRRFRCPDCNCVMRMKPEGYFSRFHASIDVIDTCLKGRLRFGRWAPYIGKSRQRHWLSALKKKTMSWFGVGKDLMTAFFELMVKGVIPVSRGM
jgi:hypothetical protein